MSPEITAAVFGAFAGAVASFAIWRIQEHFRDKSTKKALLQIFSELIMQDLDMFKNAESATLSQTRINEHLDTSLWRQHHLRLIEVAPDVAIHVNKYYLAIEVQKAVFKTPKTKQIPTISFNVKFLAKYAEKALCAMDAKSNAKSTN